MEVLRKRKDMVKLNSPQNLKSPHPWMLIFFIFWISLSKNHIFMLLCIYIVLHSHVKSYKHIYLYIYIVLLDYVKIYK
jgi:hypothetical protein